MNCRQVFRSCKGNISPVLLIATADLIEKWADSPRIMCASSYIFNSNQTAYLAKNTRRSRNSGNRSVNVAWSQSHHAVDSNPSAMARGNR